MILQWVVASLHLLALPLGLGGVVVRAAALRGPLDVGALQRVFRADTLWGVAALVWIVTGVWRAFFGLEKGTAYYLSSTAFHLKMALFLLIFALEIAPMVALMRWRGSARRGETPNTRAAARYARTSAIQAGLIVLMVFAATGMARGWLL